MAYDPNTGLEETTQQLENSPTAFNNAAEPTAEDLAADRRRMALEKSITSADNKRLQERWYGGQSSFAKAEAPLQDRGFFERGLNVLSAPAKAVVGVAQYAKGIVTQNPTGTLKETVNRNIQPGGEMWGGFLESLGIPRAVSIPLGFAMDIALDPLNVAMMGTSSLVGKTAYGIKKAGLKGASLALKEEAARTGYNVLKHAPFFAMPKSAEGAEQIALGAFAKSLPKASGVRKAWEAQASTGMKMRAFTHGLGEKAIQAGEQFDALTGRSFMDILKKEAAANAGPWGLPFRPSVKVEEFFKRHGYEEAVKAVKYSPSTYDKEAKLIELQKLKDRASGRYLSAPRTPEEIVATNRVADEAVFTVHPPEVIGEAADELMKVPPEARPLVSDMEALAEGARGILSGERALIPTSAVEWEEAGQNIAAMEVKVMQIKAEIERLRASGINPTGFKKYDDFVQKFAEHTKVRYHDKVVPVGEKVMAFVDLSNKLFSMFKVAMSPTAWVNGIVGNPTMAHLLGINIFDPGYLGSIRGAAGVMTGVMMDKKFLEKLTPFLDDINATVKRMPGYAHQTLGVDVRMMEAMQHRFVVSEAATMAKKAGVPFDEKMAEEMLHTLAYGEQQAEKLAGGKRELQALEAKVFDLKKAKASKEEIAIAEKEVAAKRVATAAPERRLPGRQEAAVQIGKDVEKAKYVAPPTSGELQLMTEDKLRELGLNKNDIPRDFVTEELFGGTMAPLLKKLDLASKGSGLSSGVARMLYLAGTKPGSWYGKIDSVYKLGTWHHLIVNGLTEGEMRLVSRVVPSLKDGVANVVHKGADLRYMLSPEAALAVVNEAYMQYAAMPNIVNFLRGLPILGSTFIAFPYAMTSKVAKAIAYNPQAFNKVQFAIQEAGGRKTPSEKAALQSEYYSQLNSPWQLRLPLFRDNPLYLNLGDALSFTTLNAFMPSERHFQDPFANIVAQVVDKSPFFKHPWGGALLDTVILPMFLHGEEAPQGYFGQRIWPTDATGLERVGYGLRNLGEAFTPAIAGYAGLGALAFPKLAEPSLVELSPSSKYRSMVYATQGKNPVGVQTKEGPGYKTLRTVLRQAGLGFTPVDTTYSKK